VFLRLLKGENAVARSIVPSPHAAGRIYRGSAAAAGERGAAVPRKYRGVPMQLPGWLPMLALVFFVRQAATQAPAGPTAVRAAASIRRLERGALLIEDFDGGHIDTQKWRIWQQEPGQTTVTQRSGRLELTAQGPVHMNGLDSLTHAKYKDVVLVGEVDVRSEGPAPHHLVLHLCGSDYPRSPDHWTEIVLVDLGKMARLSSWTTGPEGPDYHQNHQSLLLPHPPGQGFLCRIELDGGTNLAGLSVKSAGEWRRVCDPVELPLRIVHTEVKFNGNDAPASGQSGATSSRAWFAHVRIYPRPRNHYVGIHLVGPDGMPVGYRKDGGWPPMITDAAGRTRSIQDLRVELLTEDGSQVVAAVQSKNMGFYLLPLKDAPWDVYPVAAQVRLRLDGKTLGKLLRIERRNSSAAEGLYPDDVYEVAVE
jgi:hypothetical protein